MNELITVETSLQKCFGIKTEPIDDSQISLESVVIPNDIYNSIMNELSESFNGNTALKFSSSPDAYIKYKDGNYSSMIKEVSKGIKNHSGFESINLIEVADNIYNKINLNISNNILQTYNERLLRIFNDMSNRTEKAITNLIMSDHLSEIEAYKQFYEDLQNDFDKIMINPARRMAYLSDVVKKRSDIYKHFIFITNTLSNFANNLNYWEKIPSNEEIVNLLLNARFLIDLNMYNGIYEYTLSGDYAKDNEKLTLQRCKEMEVKLENTLKSLRTKLNSTYNWGTFFLPYAQLSNGFNVTKKLNYFPDEKLKFNYEIVETLQNKITSCMKNIQLLPEEDEGGW